MTLNERLHAISIDKPESNVPPKTNTLVTLLTQGLQSGDNTILNVSSISCFGLTRHVLFLTER